MAKDALIFIGLLREVGAMLSRPARTEMNARSRRLRSLTLVTKSSRILRHRRRFRPQRYRSAWPLR